MLEIAARQIKRIHVIKSSLKLSDDSYRDMLSGYGVSTSKHLNFAAAAELIVKMESLLARMRVNNKQRPQSQMKFDDLGDRDEMASPAQLRKIDVMWRNVSRQPDARSRSVALEKFLQRICGISKMEWLEPGHVKKVIKALERMAEQVKRSDRNQITTGNQRVLQNVGRFNF
jgi:phage-related protein